MTQQIKLILVGLLLLVFIAFLARGCGHYSTVNQVTYEHAKALHSVCNRQDVERSETCAAMIAEAEVNDQISSTEAGYLNEIIEVARNDQWQLMVDQVQY